MMEIFVTIINNFYLLIIFEKFSLSDVCGSAECASILWLCVIKSSFLDVSSVPISAYVTDAMALFFKMAILRTKLLPRLPVQWSSVCEIPKDELTWSKNSDLVVAVVLDLRPFKFAWEKDLRKTSPPNPLKSGRLTEDINYQKVLEGWTLHEAVSHSPTPVTCFAD